MIDMSSEAALPKKDNPIVLLYETASPPEQVWVGWGQMNHVGHLPPTSYVEEHVMRLTEQLSDNGFRFQVAGRGKQWKGWGSKVHALLPHLRRMDPEQLVVISDSRDVLLNSMGEGTAGRGPADFKARFDQLVQDNPGAVVVGSEADCCVAAMTLSETRTPGSLIDESGNRLA